MSCPDCIRIRHELDAAVERVRQLEQAAGGDMVIALQARFKVSRLDARMLAVLMNAHSASKGELLDALYGDDPNGGPDSGTKILAVLVFRLRKALRPHGIEITTHWSSGWSLTPDMKAKVRALIGGGS